MASTTDAERERDLREINVAGWKAVDAWVKRGVRIDQLDAEVERLRRENGVLRSMLYQSNPCIHEKIVAAREDFAAGRTITLEELDAALAQPEPLVGATQLEPLVGDPNKP